MQYSKEAPKEAGYYWVRITGCKEKEFVKHFKQEGVHLFASRKGGGGEELSRLLASPSSMPLRQLKKRQSCVTVGTTTIIPEPVPINSLTLSRLKVRYDLG